MITDDAIQDSDGFKNGFSLSNESINEGARRLERQQKLLNEQTRQYEGVRNMCNRYSRDVTVQCFKQAQLEKKYSLGQDLRRELPKTALIPVETLADRVN